MTARRAQPHVCRSGGFLLVETLMALLLLGLCLVPLAVILDRLGRAMVRAEERWVTAAAGSDGSTPWDWGPRPLSASWLSSGALRVTVTGTGAEGSLEIGVWKDGWLVVEVPVDDSGRATVASTTLGPLTGAEHITLRAREPGRPWGPPWRTVWGTGSPTVSSTVATLAGNTASGLVTQTVVHLPTMSSARLAVSEELHNRNVVVSAPLALPLVGSQVLVELEGRAQVVFAGEVNEAGTVHLYY